jgi:two-component system cell cycle sensor histidine kinase/response regulator CckA
MYRTPEWLLFGSILTVGVFGFIIVLLTLKYGRVLEEQKQELLALKTMAESVNRAIDRRELFQNALKTISQLLGVDSVWIYRLDGQRLTATASHGAEHFTTPFIPFPSELNDEQINALRISQIHRATGRKNDPWPHARVQSWASVPILIKDQLYGLIVAASDERALFTTKQVDLMMAFANQLGIAVENAILFDRVRMSEERYMDLFEHSPDMYHLVNREGIIVSCNHTEATRLGYQKEQLVGQSVLKLYAPAYHDQARVRLAEVFEHAREITDLEEQMVKSTDELIDVSVNSTLIKDESGRAVLMRTVSRDITERKRLEAKIIHAQRIDSIGNLAGGIAHDFNNILTSILGSAGIMKRKLKKTDPWYNFADIIETAAKRGAGLTRQLLTFARKSAVHFRPIVVNDVIEETLRLFERSIDKTITITYIPPTDFRVINGDDGQIQQALLNILINARDAMPDGGTITLTSGTMLVDDRPALPAMEQKSGTYVSIGVEDTGVGMDTLTQQRIFEPFFTTKSQGKGTGLGLSVVYGVVNSHGGFTTVRSAVGKGSTFLLHFPLLETAEGYRRPVRQKRIQLGSERILVVDDEPGVGETIRQMLTNLGYQVVVVDSGRKALSLLRKKKTFDGIILDLSMPKMSGKETFVKLRKLDKKIPVIISTGYSDQAATFASVRGDADAFLEKPYQLEELARTLRAVLDKKS